MNGLHHRVRRDDRAERGVGGREPLRARDDVRADVVALRREPVADPAERGDDLVGREQDVVAVADLAHAFPVALGRREAAAGVLHRLHVHEADRLGAHGQDRLLELRQEELRELRLRLLRRSVVAVRVRDVANLGDERLERRAQRRDAVDRQRAHGRAVVRDVARDRLVPARRRRSTRDDRIVVDLGLLCTGASAGRDETAQALLPARLVVLARELPRRLDRLGAAGAEEDAVQVAGRERRDLCRELDRTRVGVRPVRVERQLAHLLERRLADLVAERVADVDGEEAGERVDVAPPVRVLEVAAVAAHDDRDVLDAEPAHAGEVHPEVLLGGALEVERSLAVMVMRLLVLVWRCGTARGRYRGRWLSRRGRSRSRRR